ncbi:hypothetical protein JCM10213v2_001782 [Rhodosporidiobolus nylandii]
MPSSAAADEVGRTGEEGQEETEEGQASASPAGQTSAMDPSPRPAAPILPAELVDQILAEPTLKKADFAAAALVCRSFLPSARTALYRRCTLTFLQTRDWQSDSTIGHYLSKRDDALFRTLCTKSDAGNVVAHHLGCVRLVRKHRRFASKICVRIAPEQRWRRGAYDCWTFLSAHRRDLAEDLKTLLKAIGPYLVSLDTRGLDWARRASWGGPEHFASSLPLLTFTNLTSLRLEEFSPNYAPFLPALTSLDCHTYLPATLSDKLPPPVFRLDSLAVDRAPDSRELKETPFAGVPQVAALSWLLSASSASLTSLDIPFDVTFFTSATFLPSLTSLRVLRIHWCSHRDMDRSVTAEATSSACPHNFPSSLRHFSLSCEEGNMADFLAFLPASTSGLTHLSVSHNAGKPSALVSLFSDASNFSGLSELELLPFEDSNDGADGFFAEPRIESGFTWDGPDYFGWNRDGTELRALKEVCRRRGVSVKPDIRGFEDLVSLNPDIYVEDSAWYNGREEDTSDD